MRDSRKSQTNFEDQLESQLHLLEGRKMGKNLSSHKKPTLVNKTIPSDLNDISKISPKYLHNQPVFPSLSPDVSVSPKNHLKPNRTLQDCSIFATVTYSPLEQFLRTHFNTKKLILYLDELVEKIVEIYYPHKKIKSEVLVVLKNQLRSELTTTDMNVVSLNAFQILLKKKQIVPKIYFLQKLNHSKYEVKKEQLEASYESLTLSLAEKETTLMLRQEQLDKILDQIHEKQSNILKRQKKVIQKQKEIQQRYKNIKKIFEDHAAKMEEETLTKMSQIQKKLEKKMSSFERNLKYKMEGIDNKVKQVRRLKQYKESEVKASLMQNIEQNKKSEQLLKRKKYEKQIKQLSQSMKEFKLESERMEEENRKIMKLCSSLQNKTAKQEKRIKVLQKQLQKSTESIKQYELLCQEKDIAFQELNHHLYQLQNHQSKQKKQKKEENNLTTIVQVYEGIWKSHRIVNQQIFKTVETISFLISNKIRCENLVEQMAGKVADRIVQVQKQEKNGVLQNTKGILQKYLSNICIDKGPSAKKLRKSISSEVFLCKALILFVLVGTLDNPYLAALQQLMEDDQISEQIGSFVSQTNICLAILHKYRNNIDIFTDSILWFKLIGNQHTCQCLQQYGTFLLRALMEASELSTLEKLSIIVQRIVYFQPHTIQFQPHHITHLQNLHSQYQHTNNILLHNINSILAAITS